MTDIVGVIGIPWCREKDYNAFRAIFEDRNNLPTTWEEFRQRTEEAEEFYRAQGRIVERVYIDPQTFPQWCASNGYGVNSNARGRLAWRIANARTAGTANT